MQGSVSAQGGESWRGGEIELDSARERYGKRDRDSESERAGKSAKACCGHRSARIAGRIPGRVSGQPSRVLPLSGSRAERYQVVIHVEPETLAAAGEGGRCELEDGTRLTAETGRRFACDASVVAVVRGKDGSVLDVGRKTRTVPPALRRALEVRDRGCRFPGCGLRFTEVHHIRHWADGGPTSLSNCALLCRYHHRLLHEEGFRLDVVRGKYLFLARDGTPIPDKRPRRGRDGAAEDPVGALLRESRRHGVVPTYRACVPRYRRRFDVPAEVELRAFGAVIGQ